MVSCRGTAPMDSWRLEPCLITRGVAIRATKKVHSKTPRIRLFMFVSSAYGMRPSPTTPPSHALTTLSPVAHHLQPQKANREEWKEIEQYIPAPQTRWDGFNVKRGLSAASCTVHNEARAPQLLRIKRHFGLILDMPT